MSVTAVPIRPTRRRVLVMLWGGVLLAVAVAALLAVAGTRGAIAQTGSAEQFLVWNAGQSGVVTTPSGLQYRILQSAEGDRPTPEDVALINYTGRLRDGSVFDQGERAPLPVAAVVPGFSEALQLMPKGSRYRVWIPPALGYGDRDTGGVIPPGSVLEFDIDLIDFIPASVLQGMQGMGGMPPGMPGMPGGPPPQR